MSKELTEKLKQGNLKDGYYYAKMPIGCVDVVSLYNLRQLRLAKDGDKIEVLDIVPDYYQFQNICNEIEWLKVKVLVLNTGNQNLEKNFYKAIKYYNNIDVNGNYPDKISQLKAYIKKLTNENEKLKERNGSLYNRDINLCRIVNGIRDENYALKELLKECLEVLTLVAGETIYFPRTVDECIEKINLALGEDK